MANIEQDLQAIMDARYGRDVRQSIHDAIKDINDQEEGHVSVIEGYTEDAEAWAVGTKNGTPVESTDPTYENNAKYLAEQASTSATNAGISESNANTSESNAEAWAVGKRVGVDVPSTDPTYENNAKYWQERANYWYQQAQAIAESFSGALRPMGTVTFANLPPLAEATAGDMYNISDEFTTTSDFKEGAGHVIPLGSNIYKTTDNKWDVLAGSPVTGIKGDNEQAYRKGNVNITKGNIGLGNVDNESLGSADISAIGDGSVKGAISSLNNHITQMGSVDLLGYITGGTGSDTVNLPSGKKFSDYASVYLTFDLNGNHYAPTTIPLNAFTGHQTMISFYDTSQNVVGFLTPISDTQFTGESLVSGYTLVVYGVGRGNV